MISAHAQQTGTLAHNHRAARAKSSEYTVNAFLIEEFTGIANYKGRADQIKAVMKSITKENYSHMRERIHDLETQDTITGSSNFGKFIELFESSDVKWIDRINEVLDG